MADNGAKRATVEDAMIGYDQLGKGDVTTDDDMTAGLT